MQGRHISNFFLLLFFYSLKHFLFSGIRSGFYFLIMLSWLINILTLNSRCIFSKIYAIIDIFHIISLSSFFINKFIVGTKSQRQMQIYLTTHYLWDGKIYKLYNEFSITTTSINRIFILYRSKKENNVCSCLSDGKLQMQNAKCKIPKIYISISVRPLYV